MNFHGRYCLAFFLKFEYQKVTIWKYPEFLHNTTSREVEGAFCFLVRLCWKRGKKERTDPPRVTPDVVYVYKYILWRIFPRWLNEALRELRDSGLFSKIRSIRPRNARAPSLVSHPADHMRAHSTTYFLALLLLFTSTNNCLQATSSTWRNFNYPGVLPFTQWRHWLAMCAYCESFVSFFPFIRSLVNIHHDGFSCHFHVKPPSSLYVGVGSTRNLAG